MTRTERQKECVRKWLNNKGIGVVLACTGFGKSRTAISAIKLLINRNPDAFVLISVPTEVLKEQWLENLIHEDLLLNCKVEIINTIIKHEYDVDLLVIDEIHSTASDCLREIFNCVNYKLILGLTATLERLDGKEEIIKQYCPVVDEISLDEASKNGWVSPVKEYLVLLDVDLAEYNEWNRKFIGFFSYMNYDFNLAMKLATNAITRNKYAKKLGLKPKELAGIAYGWMQALRKRKAFVQSHPKKFEIAEKILNFRKDKKCVTFSATIKDAEKFKTGYVLHSKKSKKENKTVLEKFNADATGVLHSSKSVDTGVDVKGLSVGIILSTDSSKIRKIQRSGRICRFEPGKQAEMFTLIIKGTQEWNWAMNSAYSNYIVINEEQLDKVLNYENIETRERETIENKTYRF